MSIEYNVPELSLYLKIDTTVLQQIENYSKQYYPKEIGGVLVGSYSLNSKRALVKYIVIPQKIISGPYFFERKINWINKELQRFHEESDGSLIYLGEWHSHPDMEAIPSQTDIAAIQEISTDNGVKIEAPILLIAHVSELSFHTKPYIHYNGLLYAYQVI